jgi:hypothetical protein
MPILARVHRQWAGDRESGLVQVKRPDRWIRMIMPGFSRIEP